MNTILKAIKIIFEVLLVLIYHRIGCIIPFSHKFRSISNFPRKLINKFPFRGTVKYFVIAIVVWTKDPSWYLAWKKVMSKCQPWIESAAEILDFNHFFK